MTALPLPMGNRSGREPAEGLATSWSWNPFAAIAVSKTNLPGCQAHRGVALPLEYLGECLHYAHQFLCEAMSLSMQMLQVFNR